MVVICPTAQEESARRAICAWVVCACAPLSPRHCERKRSNPDCLRGCSLDCFVALLLAMTATVCAVIPGRRHRVRAKRGPMTGSSVEPGIHNHHREYGFRAHAFGVPRNDERRERRAYCFGWPKSSGGSSICGTSILT